MAYELPKRRTLVHKAVEPRNLSAKRRAEVEARAGDYWEVKYDGCHCVVVVPLTGPAIAYTRQGEVVNGSMNHVLRLLEAERVARSGGGIVLFGEAWHPDWTHQKINGTYRRGADGSELELVVFDAVRLHDFEAGKSDITYRTRRWAYTELVYQVMKRFDNHDAAPLRTAALFDSKEKAEQYVGGMQQLSEFAIDGFMRKDPVGEWVAGAGLGGEVVKCKDIVDVDVEVLEVFEGQGKFAGMAGGFVIRYKGQTQSCGGGKLTTPQRKALWKDYGKSKIGKIIQVHGLSESEDGKLREPRFIRWREDKTEGE